MKEPQPKSRYEQLNDDYRIHLRAARRIKCPPLKRYHEAKATEAMKEMHELADLLPFHPTITRALGWRPVNIGAKCCQFCNEPMAVSLTVCPSCLLINL